VTSPDESDTVENHMNRREELIIVIEIARAAGALAMEQYGKVLRLTKTNRATQNEAVTEADRSCQRLIVSALKKHFPTDGIIGEESDDGSDITVDVRDPNGRVWVIDPIDGTNNFIGGADNFAICIGLLEAGVATLGVVFDVTRNRVYAGAKDVGAFVTDRAAHAPTDAMSDASILMCTSNLLNKQGVAPGWIHTLMSQTTWKVRMIGSAALEAVAVAGGTAHAAITVNGKLWDCVAPAAVVLAAGGVVTDFAGKPIFPFDLTNYGGAKVPYISAGPAAHSQILKLMRENP
jgi:myo-inositol-1(or 4)-monophosphatase